MIADSAVGGGGAKSGEDGKTFGDWWFSLTEKVDAPPNSLATEIKLIDNKIVIVGMVILLVSILGTFAFLNNQKS